MLLRKQADMKPVKSCSTVAAAASALVVLLAWLAVSIAGCKPFEWPHIGGMGGKDRLKVESLSNRDVAALSSDDIVRIMRRAGFSDEQILNLGTDVRNALLVSGASQVKKGKVEVIFAVHGEYVFITTRLRGSFIYDIKRGKFGIAPSSSGSS